MLKVLVNFVKNVDEIIRIFRTNGGRQLLSYIDACISILQLMFDEYFDNSCLQRLASENTKLNTIH